MLVLRRPPFVKLTCLCLELGDLATCRRPPRVTVRPARPPPSYAAAPRVSAGTTSVRGERARHQNTRAAPVAHRGPPRGSGGLPGRGGGGQVVAPAPAAVLPRRSSRPETPTTRRAWGRGVGGAVRLLVAGGAARGGKEAKARPSIVARRRGRRLAGLGGRHDDAVARRGGRRTAAGLDERGRDDAARPGT